MKEVDYTNAYAMALAQFNLMQIKQENELLKTTAGATVPIPAYNFLPVSRIENIGSSVRFSDCFEPIKPPEPDEYDLMMTIAKVVCPIWVITGKEPKEWNTCPHAANDWYEWQDGKCDECIQKFLNEESEVQR